jgi:dTDP-4-dehydrorhamnose reductase
MAADKPSILVTGANGQLGRSIQAIAHQFEATDFLFMGREHLPINDFALVDKVVETLKPFAIINAAAYTAVDKAESETDKANMINGYAVGNLAAAAKRVGSKFLHVSTDYVFDGNGTQPYREDDATNPVNAYGRSKLLGEQLALQEYPESIIVRTSWVYSRYGANFVKTMIRLMLSRPQIGVVHDQKGCPTHATSLALALVTMAKSHQKGTGGIYHFSNSGIISWFQFAEAICKAGEFNCTVNPILTKDYPTPAKRPVYSALSCSKIQEVFQITQTPWQEALLSDFGAIKSAVEQTLKGG